MQSVNPLPTGILQNKQWYGHPYLHNTLKTDIGATRYWYIDGFVSNYYVALLSLFECLLHCLIILIDDSNRISFWESVFNDTETSKGGIQLQNAITNVILVSFKFRIVEKLKLRGHGQHSN